MQFISFQSGSNGNCIHVEAAGVRLLFDAGISGIQAQQRLALHGRDIWGIDPLLISHDHSDHARDMGVFHRKFALPIYVTPKTYLASSRYGPGEMKAVSHFSAGESLGFGRVTVETISTPHDGVDGVGFVVDDGKHRLGVLTDLGHVFDYLEPIIRSFELLLKTASKRLKWACLAHLSHEPNTPDLALQTHRRILGNRLPLFLATRHEPTAVLEV